LAAARADLAEIDSALGRLDDGSYGRCEQCGAAIAPERLLARPAARQCFTCASRR
jgi:DnaK suppressor protein